MSVINTNVNSLMGLSNLRKTNFGVQASLEKLSSGYRINKAADDPAGLTIATVMTAQIGGIRMATQNAEDGINLIQTADGALIETQAILQRMRDLAVRSANEATLTASDQQRLEDEFGSLRSELTRKAYAITFNTKKLFADASGPGAANQDQVFGTQVLQIGPDASTQYRMDITLSIATASALGLASVAIASGTGNLPGGSPAVHINSTAGAQAAISQVNTALNNCANMRARLGVQQRRLNHIINDLDAADINISAARSRILDADMAQEISEFTKLQILQQSGTAILAQANAQPQSVLQLLR